MLGVLGCSFLTAGAQQLAFPGAEGFGKYAKGGRGGTVYHVTNLNDNGPGSLRDAVSSPNRIVVFDVAGVIRINARMIVSSNVYIAGQTAPGEGITVYGNGWTFSGASNSICRYIKIRMGIVGSSGQDANGIANGHDMIFDHCSISWGRDENFSINSTTAYNITIQNSIISQGLMTHSAGGLIQADSITLYRNLYVDNATRNNKVKGISQYVNNLVYAWESGAYIMGGDSQGSSYVNVTNNLFIRGPFNGVPPFNLGNADFHMYAIDNIFDRNQDGNFDPSLIPESEYVGGPSFEQAPFDYPELPAWSANKLVDSLLPSVGASLPYRDYADYYVVNEVKSFGKKGELIANESSLPFGAPNTWNLWAGTPRVDTDGDGMPDAWETANGTNPNVDDAMAIGSTGYANIELYINSISEEDAQEFLRAPMNLKLDSANQSTVYLSWFDYTEKEDGYKVEKNVGGVWTEIAATGVNENTIAIGGMDPEQSETYRVVAFNQSGLSGYSNELVAKTKPVEVPVLDPLSFAPDLTWSGASNSTWDLTSDNWLDNGGAAATYSSDSKLLFGDHATPQEISLSSDMSAGDILVNAQSDYTFSGTGVITGAASMNKTGAGTLSLLSKNTYTGPTVLHEGEIVFNSLANGGAPSAIGASENYGFNWVWRGGTWSYTGGSVGTDRNAVIDRNTTFNVTDGNAVVTFNGVISGEGGLVKSGPGTMVLRSENPYAGETVINGGVLEVRPVSSSTLAEDIIDNNRAIGTSKVMRLNNGTFRTTGGSTTIYEEYLGDLYVADHTVNGFEPYRNANIKLAVHGAGTLNYKIPYLREMIQGDWSDFTGRLVANGTTEALLVVDNHVGFPNTVVELTGITKMVNWSNEETISIGGLSGVKGTMLSTGGIKTASFGFGRTTYAVGGAGTDETFEGVINNQPYGATTNTDAETSIIKEGLGIWRLTGTNTYNGTTLINEGTLVVNGSNNGNGKVTVAETGILAGKGSIASQVEVLEGGKLQPGDSAVGKLTFKSDLTLSKGSMTEIEISKDPNNQDQIAVTGNLNYGGVLKIVSDEQFELGDVFQVFLPGLGTTGGFESIESPSLPAGLSWKFKPATGELKVETPGYVDAPSGLTLDASTDIPAATSAIAISWTDNADNELSFKVERSTDGTLFSEVASLAANTQAYTDEGLTPATTYYYRLKAVGSEGESVYTEVKSVKTPPPYNEPVLPYSPAPGDATSFSSMVGGDLMLRWKGGDFTQQYAVYLGSSPEQLAKQGEVAFAEDGSFKVAGLDYNTTYYWRVDATGDGHTTTGDIWSFKTGGPTSMIVHYKLDETAGTTVVDAGTAGLNGTTNFTPDWQPSVGRLSGALGFSQATSPTSAIVVPANDAVTLDNTSFTISMWVKIPSNTYIYANGADCYLIHKGTFEANTGKWYGLQLKDGRLVFGIDDGVNKGSVEVTLTGANDLFDNTWKHIVAVRDVPNKTISLYLNGVKVSQVANVKTTGIGQADKDLVIGNSAEQNPYRDLMDDVRIYDNALSDADIYSIYSLSDAATLPVRVADFHGKVIGANIALSWQSLSEVKTAQFEVLRSSDGLHYQRLEMLNAKGSSATEVGYSITDHEPTNGMNYYRLVIHNQDGSSQVVAETKLAYQRLQTSFKLYPNPFSTGTLSFTLTGWEQNSPFTASIVTMGGVIVQKAVFDFNKANTYQMKVQASLKPGVYLFVVDNGQVRKSKQLIVK